MASSYTKLAYKIIIFFFAVVCISFAFLLFSGVSGIKMFVTMLIIVIALVCVLPSAYVCLADRIEKQESIKMFDENAEKAIRQRID